MTAQTALLGIIVTVRHITKSGLAMYIEKEGLSWSEQEAPTFTI